MDESFVSCINVSKQYGNTSVIDDINFQLDKGEILSLVGPSGSGKTTILRSIAGLEQVSTGEIWVDGINVTHVKAENRPIVMMFQQALLFPHLTVLENVMYGAKKLYNQRKNRIYHARQLLEKIELIHYEKKYPYELSGGQQQRVALGRALMTKPKLLLLDEPFSSLDPQLRSSIREWIVSLLQKENITTIFVTHDKEEAMTIGNRVAIVMDNKIQQLGAPLDVYNHPVNVEVARFFSDGLITDHNKFIPIQDLELLPSNNQIDQHKLAFSGKVMNRFIKHGQLFDQIEVDQINKSVTVPSNSRVKIGEKVKLVTNRSNVHTFLA
ncbi:ABC transporter ATP-binding protein [Cytobacillus sp. IB215316]|uniref:ABC transporter ATP-binding protein n=1 Tax=Cytobacillus sp. IB215316 TaxID=3097354 RepID=UPI002A1273BF|nr:ABC transporter ATP-binding protein [Cytobacillus sp. IB215316]MDX8362509.1 ABC transporter ATP-binding protein [Cytobacillus sp. IB215316]